jgi:hypothetical protein
VIEGIDISHWQAQTPPLGTSLGFVFARATYGTYPDDRYAQHAANVRAAGKVLGAYHFGRYGDPASQARAFLATIGDVRLVALDFEKDGTNRHMTPDQARLFIRSVQATGRTVGLYASDSGFPSLGQNWNWVANWSDRPSRPWAFWQYEVSGTPRIDRDRFDGTMEQLRALAGLAPEPKPFNPTPGKGEANVTIRYSSATSTSRMTLAQGQLLYASPGGRAVTRMSRTAPVPHVGLAATGWRAVIVGTRSGYADGKVHRTVLYVPAKAGEVTKA